MSFFFKTKREVVGIIDIGGSSIGISVLEITENKKQGKNAKLIFSGRREMLFQENLDLKRYFDESIATLRQFLRKTLKELPARPTQYLCFLSSPFFVSQTKILNYEDLDGFIVSKGFLQKIAGLEAEKFISENELLNPAMAGKRPTLLENRLMQIKLNGYEDLAPINKKAEKISIGQYLSLSSEQILERLKEVIIAETHDDSISFATWPFVAYDSIRDLQAGNQNFAVIDVTGELTDIIVSADGILSDVSSFPLGQNSIIRNLAKKLSSPISNAQSLLEMYQTGRLNEITTAKVEKILNEEKSLWLEQLNQLLVIISQGLSFPDTIYVLADGLNGQIVASWLQSGDFKKLTLNSGIAQIHLLSSEKILQHINTSDAALLLEIIFCAKILSIDQIN